MKKQLKNVTLLAADCIDAARAGRALDICEQHFDFAKSVLATSLETNDPRAVSIPKIGSLAEYSKFCVKELTKFFDTEFVLVCQHDGFVYKPELWEDQFLEYDYIGAPWPQQLLWPKVPRHFQVGNGGFSIRSKKLQDFLRKNYSMLKQHMAEDVVICQYNRAMLEKKGFKFAPVDVAYRFSVECGEMHPAFGQHARMRA